ncbi:hypothetical protein CORT_0G02380 [Candida orthopsilosis Co 90-125]|uniref:Uncharacterized protein n=1 Tax=Candida orthopsilosis (strain 90-125) TaxID=1136231 RepID=H8XAR8_CANO9|nr:hypothetical protein CORT_0G02380 [Candida orthopsilosis Co 90-125]CCG24919.1 hypothetical protein CORT_0G02380 [Candida orthopsilosis Co 90-125]
MMLSVTLPRHGQSKRAIGTQKVPLEFVNGDQTNKSSSIDLKSLPGSIAIPVFSYNGQVYVLIKHLATLWNFLSSYQLILSLSKHGIEKKNILQTDPSMNDALFTQGAISKEDQSSKLFYISLPLIYLRILNKDVFYNSGYADEDLIEDISSPGRVNSVVPVASEEQEDEPLIDDEEEDEVDDAYEEGEMEEEDKEGALLKQARHHHFHKRTQESESSGDDRVTVSQVFPQYGVVESTTQLNHTSFGTLNSSTKLNFYKTLSTPGLRFLPNTKLNFNERELLLGSNNFSDIQIEGGSESLKRQGLRKPLGRSRKNNIHIDPNTLDLSESVVPGQGYIPEFSVSHLCKVPNYYITSNQQAPSQSFNTKKLNTTSNSSFLFTDGIKMSKNIQQLVFSNESDNYHHSKYFYTKGYRGPGSGNYKDGALMKKISKIPVSSDRRRFHKTKLSNREKYNKSLKGLAHERFNKNSVERLLAEQRKYTEDYLNLEMLHNSVQFNFLLNSYREIAEETWNCYFKFKLFDLEQYKALQSEKDELKERDRLLSEHKKWIEDDKLREERLRMIFSDEHAAKEKLKQEFVEKRKEMEEKRRRLELEASFDNSINKDDEGADFAEKLEALDSEYRRKQNDLLRDYDLKKKQFLTPLKPPQPIETPQIDIVSKFVSPAAHPEILRQLPLELRDVADLSKDVVPSIKNPIKYVTTFPTNTNDEYLTRIEVVKLPNANSIGWDNLRKYKEP